MLLNRRWFYGCIGLLIGLLLIAIWSYHQAGIHREVVMRDHGICRMSDADRGELTLYSDLDGREHTYVVSSGYIPLCGQSQYYGVPITIYAKVKDDSYGLFYLSVCALSISFIMGVFSLMIAKGFDYENNTPLGYIRPAGSDESDRREHPVQLFEVWGYQNRTPTLEIMLELHQFIYDNRHCFGNVIIPQMENNA